MKSSRRLVTYLTRYWGLIGLTLLLSIIFVALNSLSLWMIASLINTVMVSPESIPVQPVDIPAFSRNHQIG